MHNNDTGTEPNFTPKWPRAHIEDQILRKERIENNLYGNRPTYRLWTETRIKIELGPQYEHLMPHPLVLPCACNAVAISPFLRGEKAVEPSTVARIAHTVKNFVQGEAHCPTPKICHPIFLCRFVALNETTSVLMFMDIQLPEAGRPPFLCQVGLSGSLNLQDKKFISNTWTRDYRLRKISLSPHGHLAFLADHPRQNPVAGVVELDALSFHPTQYQFEHGLHRKKTFVKHAGKFQEKFLLPVSNATAIWHTTPVALDINSTQLRLIDNTRGRPAELHAITPDKEMIFRVTCDGLELAPQPIADRRLPAPKIASKTTHPLARAKDFPKIP
ncbi:MAG: hypothetical protein ACOY3I_07235 [Verrucomicrobiota bacterium]